MGLERNFESVISTIITKMQSEILTVAGATSLMFNHRSWLQIINNVNDALLLSGNLSQQTSINHNVIRAPLVPFASSSQNSFDPQMMMMTVEMDKKGVMVVEIKKDI